MASVVVFDVNETLLDLSALDERFEEICGERRARGEWFAQLLQSALVTTILGRYTDFSRQGDAALTLIAQRYGVEITPAQRNAVAMTMRQLPPHPEVPQALSQLQHAGVRMAALTNSPERVMHEQLEHAGLSAFFERCISVDSVRCFKPAADVYRKAAEELAVVPGDMWMVAAHDWDLAGAAAVGCATAFVARGRIPNPLLDPPSLVGQDMTEVVNQIMNAG